MIRWRWASCGRVCLAAGCWWLATVDAPGHQDPRGDIHPQVSVADDKFVVDFQTSVPDEVGAMTATPPLFRMIFTADGKLFAPRHPVDRRRSYTELGPVGLYGRSFRIGDSTMIFPGDQAGQPGYLLRTADGKVTRVSLPWPKQVSLWLLEDALPVPAGIAMTGKEGEPNMRHPDGGPLKFYWFAHESTAAPVILTIGATACIYSFPVASNLAFAGGRFWVAAMVPASPEASDEEADGLRLALWSWQPGDKDGRVEFLDSPVHWNCRLSLATIGDRLCLAYHCATRESYYGDQARIVTVFREAK